MLGLLKLFRQHFWGVLLLIVLLGGSSIAVQKWKAAHPGSMSVLESQAMDMTIMKPPVGASPVATETVHLGHFQATVTYTGSVAPLQEQMVYPRVEGYLKKLSIYNGDRVSSNQLIAVLDSPDLQSKVAEASAGQAVAASEIPTAQYNVARMNAERSAARAEVKSAESELVRANAMVTSAENAIAQKRQDVKSAKANLDYWKAEIAREERLLKAGAVSTQEYQSEVAQSSAAEAEYQNKRAMLDEAKSDLQAAKADAASKRSMIDAANQRVAAASAASKAAGAEVRQKTAMVRQAGAMVSTAATIDEYRYVHAPFAGTVSKRYVSPGQYVNQSTAIASIVQIDTVRLQANVSDRDLAAIRLGAPVVARFAKDPKLVINAKVSSISPLADQASRTAVVEAVVPNTGHKLVPGDAVTLDIAVSADADSISLPSSAIIQKGGTNSVWVVRNEAPKGKVQYTCTMHPEVISDKPGTCPKCLMKLVSTTSGGNKKAHLVTVTIGADSGDRTQIIGGLSDGDDVIYEGNTYLKEGDTVFSTHWTADGPKQMSDAPEMGSMPGMSKEPSNMQNMPGMDDSKPKTRPSAPTKAATTQKVYICPMDPQVTSDKPGTCRICGMQLELKK